MTRRGRISIVAMGAAVSLLMGSGLFALTSDTVRSNSNSVQSGTFALPAHDLQAAQVVQAGECAGATYTDGPFTATIENGPVNLGTGIGPVGTGSFCLRNSGAESGRLTVLFQGAIDRELGACETSEADAGDVTCADGDPGELRAVLFPFFMGSTTSSSSCAGSSGTLSFDAFEFAPRVLDSDIAPGEFCPVRLAISTSAGFGSDTANFLAQTDRVQWDIVFMLEDI